MILHLTCNKNNNLNMNLTNKKSCNKTSLNIRKDFVYTC